MKYKLSLCISTLLETREVNKLKHSLNWLSSDEQKPPAALARIGDFVTRRCHLKHLAFTEEMYTRIVSSALQKIKTAASVVN